MRAAEYANSAVVAALAKAREAHKDIWEDELRGEEPPRAPAVVAWTAAEQQAAIGRAKAAADAVVAEAVKLSKEPGAFL